MQDHERKSHKLTAKLNCEYFFIAAESQDYPRPTIEPLSRIVFFPAVPDLENKKKQYSFQIVKDCNFRKS
jgi:hypothetical protein